MTEPSVALKQYLSNIGLDSDVDFLRESIQLMMQMLIELEAEEQIRAEKHERTSKGTSSGSTFVLAKSTYLSLCGRRLV